MGENLVHRHPMTYINTTKFYGPWVCDACDCESRDLEQQYSFRCAPCDFDLCKSCHQETVYPFHRHPIRRTDARIVYGTTGMWQCNVCRTKRRPDNDRYGYLY